VFFLCKEEVAIPKMGIPQKINLKKSDIFLAPKNHHPKTSIRPSIHHNFTSTTPRLSTCFCQNPL